MNSKIKICAALSFLALGACSHLPGHNPMATWVQSRNHNARGAVLIVVHSTEQKSVQASLDTLRSRNAQGKVSAHYLIGRDGHVYQLVSERRRGISRRSHRSPSRRISESSCSCG